jgi:phosphate starvation-inducible PhoH-like protein
VLLEDIRGRSLNDAFVILDEAQNLLPSHVKTVLTRIGSGSKMAMVGDTRQVDLEVFDRSNGLLDATYRLRDLREVDIVKFEKEDVVRNSVIGQILDRYED